MKEDEIWAEKSAQKQKPVKNTKTEPVKTTKEYVIDREELKEILIKRENLTNRTKEF